MPVAIEREAPGGHDEKGAARCASQEQICNHQCSEQSLIFRLPSAARLAFACRESFFSWPADVSRETSAARNLQYAVCSPGSRSPAPFPPNASWLASSGCVGMFHVKHPNALPARACRALHACVLPTLRVHCAQPQVANLDRKRPNFVFGYCSIWPLPIYICKYAIYPILPLFLSI